MNSPPEHGMPPGMDELTFRNSTIAQINGKRDAKWIFEVISETDKRGWTRISIVYHAPWKTDGPAVLSKGLIPLGDIGVFDTRSLVSKGEDDPLVESEGETLSAYEAAVEDAQLTVEILQFFMSELLANPREGLMGAMMKAYLTYGGSLDMGQLTRIQDIIQQLKTQFLP